MLDILILQQALVPGARFSKAAETFRARKVSKNGEVHAPEARAVLFTFSQPEQKSPSCTYAISVISMTSKMAEAD